MQTITLDLPNGRFFCPATGEVIFDTEQNYTPKSVMGFWVGDFFDVAEIFNKELEEVYTQYLKESNDTTSQHDEFLNFIKNLDINQNWVLFELTNNSSWNSVVYYIIDLNTETDEIKT